jgi:pyruvyltransferase
MPNSIQEMFKLVDYVARRIFSRANGFVNKNSVYAYWYEAERNFGDLLNPMLLKHYGLTPIKTIGSNCEVVMVGSILDNLSAEFSGTILGSGLMYEKPCHFPKAKILGVRGKLTHELIGAPKNAIVGDPGLLISNFYSRSIGKKYILGLIPHYRDKSDIRLLKIKNRYKNEVMIIDVQDDIEKVIEKINLCQFILSSALHGLVAADSLGIPNGWISLSTTVKGSGFKFRDYASAIDRTIYPNEIDGSDTLIQLCNLCIKPENIVNDIKFDLNAVFERFSKEILDQRRIQFDKQRN